MSKITADITYEFLGSQYAVKVPIETKQDGIYEAIEEQIVENFRFGYAVITSFFVTDDYHFCRVLYQSFPTQAAKKSTLTVLLKEEDKE